MAEHPCETCLRWPECNGVDAEICSVVTAAKAAEDNTLNNGHEL